MAAQPSSAMHPDRRLRRAVHAAHRAPHPRAPRLLRDRAALGRRRASCAQLAPRAVVLSGGPASVLRADAPRIDPRVSRARRAGARHLLRHAAPDAASSAAASRRRTSASTAARSSSASDSDDPLFAGLPAAQHRLDEPRRPRDRAAATGFEPVATSDELAVRRGAITRAQASTACSSTPRSCTPTRGMRRCSGTSCAASAAAPATGRWRVHRRRARARCARGSATARSSAALSGGVDSSVVAVLLAQRDRRAAALHLRRQRPAARGRARGGRAARSASELGIPLVTSTRASVPARARAASTDPEKKRSHHRPHLHRRRSSEQATQHRARALPRAGHAYPDVIESRLRARPVGHDQDPPQRRRPARA